MTRKLAKARICKTPGVCGGEACVRGTRIPVWLLAWHWSRGQTEREILADFPSLKAPWLRAAIEYTKENKDEIAMAIRRNS